MSLYGANQYVPRDNGGVIDFGDGNTKRIGAERGYNDAGKFVGTKEYSVFGEKQYGDKALNTPGYGNNSQQYAAQAAAMTRQAGQDALANNRQAGQDGLELARARDQDANQAGRKVAFEQANADESKTSKERTYNSEEKALDRAKSSKEFNAGLGQQDKQVAQSRSDMEYQIMMADRNSEKARNFETFTRANDNLNQRAAQTADINSNEKLANISQQTSLSGQKSQEEQARIAAKAQVTSALMGSRSNYGGYW